MQQSAIITTRRNDASLIARVTLDPNYPPESVTGDSLLDRVASAVNSAAGDLNVASIEVFPPAIVADTAILQHPDTVWSFLPVNIEGNACYTRKPSYDPFSYHPQDVAEGIVPADSEPVSEPKSEAIAGPKSQPKSEGESATADGPAIREVAAILGVDLDSVPISCRSTERELPLAADAIHRTAAFEAGVELWPAQADKLALAVAVGASVLVDKRLPGNTARVLISRHGEQDRQAYLLDADGVLRREGEDRPKDDGLDGLRGAIAAGFAAQNEPEKADPNWGEDDPVCLRCGARLYETGERNGFATFACTQCAFEGIAVSETEVVEDRAAEAEHAADDFELPDLNDSAVQDQVLAFLIDIQGEIERSRGTAEYHLLQAIHNELHDRWAQPTEKAPEIEQIAAGLKALDWELVAAAHENRSEPFWTIIAKRRRPVFPAAPYVICDFDYSGISNGHYDLTRERAFRVFTDKVAGREEV